MTEAETVAEIEVGGLVVTVGIDDDGHVTVDSPALEEVISPDQAEKIGRALISAADTIRKTAPATV